MTAVPEFLPLAVTSIQALVASLVPWMRAATFQINRTSNLTGILTATATWNPGSVADGDVVTVTIAVANSALGDICSASLTTLTTATLTIHAHVQAAGTVQVQLENNTGSPVNLASGTLRVMVVQF